MPPDPPSWIFPEPLDPLALLDDAVQELAARAAIPPVSGGQLPGFLGDAWDWTKGNLMDPGGDFLRDVLTEIGRAVSGAVTTVLSWILKWVYHIVRFSLWYAVPDSHQLRFPSVFDESTQSPYEYLSRILRIVGSVVEGIVGPMIGWVVDHVIAWVGWVWDRVQEGVGWVVGHVIAWAGWVWDRVQEGVSWLSTHVIAWAGWVWDRVQEGVSWLSTHVITWAGWVWDRVQEGIGWVVDHVTTWAGWVWDRVQEGIGWVVDHVIAWAGWVWDRVQEGLQWAWDNVISKIPEGIVAGAAEIGKLIREAFEWLIARPFEAIQDVLQHKLGIPGRLLRAEYRTPFDLIDDIMDPIAPAMLIGGILAMLVLMPAISSVVGASTAIGFEEFYQRQRANVGARIPPFAMLRGGLLRELLPESEHDDWLGRQGFNAANIELQKALYDEIPGPTDLVRMGVREVFTPEIAERFGQFEDFPTAFAEWMGKQGFTEEWALNFWGAHWDLPSVTQGFEMFHRDVIPEADLQLLLRALDVMPYWRDKLTEIAYRVITRVDVRRMYAEGVFDRGQVLRVYKDLGYKPEDAEALTEFVVLRYPPKGPETADDLRSKTMSTIKQAYARRLITPDAVLEGLQELDYSPDDARLIVSIWEFDWTQDPSQRSDVDPKGLARSVIEKAYERRLIDLNGGVRELGELGYIPEDARLLLQLVDLRLDEQLADLEIDGLVSDYQDGVISDGQLAAALADLHVPQARIDFLLQREILSRRAKRRRLTLSQMKKALAERLMDVGEYRARLDVMGYNDRDVEILVALNVGSV